MHIEWSVIEHTCLFFKSITILSRTTTDIIYYIANCFCIMRGRMIRWFLYFRSTRILFIRGWWYVFIIVFIVSLCQKWSLVTMLLSLVALKIDVLFLTVIRYVLNNWIWLCGIFCFLSWSFRMFTFTKNSSFKILKCY